MASPSSSFPPLHLPPAPLRLQNDAQGRRVVFDVLRRRYVVLSPEEWVRQHFVHHLLAHLGYPAGLLGNEVSIEVGGVSRRCDTVLFAREGMQPRLIVEYKAPQVPISEAVFHQIQSYNSVLRAEYLIVSNGLKHYCCRLDYEQQQLRFLPQIPSYDEL